MSKPQVLLTFGDTARRNDYGESALAALRALAEVRLHTGDLPLAGRMPLGALNAAQATRLHLLQAH